MVPDHWYYLHTFFKACPSKKTTWSRRLIVKFKTHKTLKAAIPCLAARSRLGKLWECPYPPVGREETKFLIVIAFLFRPFPLLIIAVFKVLFPLRENYISVQMTSLAVDPFPLFAWLDTGKQFKAATKIVPDRRASAHEEGWFQRVVCEALKVRENSGIVCKRNQHAVLLCRFIIVGFSSAMKIYPAGFLKTWLPPNRPLPSNHSQKVANIKTKTASIAVSLPFLSSSSFLPLLVWLLSLSGAENLPFGPFPLKWLQISLGSLSKNRLEILSAKDWSVGKRHFFWSVMAAYPEKDLSKVTAGIVGF